MPDVTDQPLVLELKSQQIQALDSDELCWVCGAPILHRRCKIVCPRCGFLRDCSDP